MGCVNIAEFSSSLDVDTKLRVVETFGSLFDACPAKTTLEVIQNE